MKNILKQVIADQAGQNFLGYIIREIPENLLVCNEILVISGIRRSGKSTLVQQIRSKMAEKDYYLNFDDERLINFKVDDFQLLYETFIELFGEQKTFYFDEIQNIYGWERFVRRLYDMGNKVIVTGSNATMLSRELGTHLTGRFCRYELYPFSFLEYLKLLDISFRKKDLFNTQEKSLLNKAFLDYFKFGGFPGYLKNRNHEYLKSLYESILYRDVMVRNNITNEKEMLELVYFLASNVSKLSSNNSLTKIIGVKNATTIKNYIGYLENSYLVFQINKFDYSVKKQINNPKKTYFIDNALVDILGFSFSENQGRLLENLVFIELKRRLKDIYYHSNDFECDFLIRDGIKITGAIQVCAYFENQATKDREIKGLNRTMEEYDLREGFIITFNNDEEIVINNRKIIIVSALNWFLDI